MINRPIYIYTVPKAGTYFLANLVESLGYENTGWHIEIDGYLDTKNFSKSENKHNPSQTKVKQPFVQTFKQIKPYQLAFGHLPPTKLPRELLKQIVFISSYRNPREVLESEFIDFRYRRKDVEFVSQARIVDDFCAFEVYLERHSPIIKDIYNEFFLVQQLVKENAGNICFSFKELIDDYNHYSILHELIYFLDCKVGNLELFLKNIKSQETKTKSIDLDLPFKRAELWNNETNFIYQNLGFKEIETNLQFLSLP